MSRTFSWQLVVGLLLIGAWAILGLAAPLVSGVDPLREHGFIQEGTRSVPAPFEPGTFGFPLGSDRNGRDIWTNLMFGARATFGLVFVVLAVRFVVGVALGGIAGWFAGRWPDRIVSTLIDAFAAFPTLLFAVLWILAFDIRSGVGAFAAALAITGWWGLGRATRSSVAALRGRPFLEAARAGGLSEFAVFARHAVPNLLPLLAVATALEASAIALVLGELGFLGYVVGGGTSILRDDQSQARVFFFGTPEWGAILAQGRFEIYRAPWIAVMPALAFASAVLGFNLAGYGLRRFFERSPITFGRILSWRTVAALVAVFAIVRLASPFVGPAAGYTRVSREFAGDRAMDHVAYFADPARGGRYTGSAGYDDSAAYVAARFAEAGLEPLGDDGTYLQRFRLANVGLTGVPTLEQLGPQSVRYALRDDFREQVGGRRGSGTAEGSVVFVGGGKKSPEYSDYEGVHAGGNIVMVAGPTDGDAVDTAIREGAKGVLFVEPAGRPLIKPSYIAAFEKDTLPVLTISERVADELIASSGKRVADLRSTLEERERRARDRPSLQKVIPVPLSFDTSTRIRFSVPLGPVETIVGTNVAGMLRGSDPERAGKFVVVGGHLDGVGTDPDGAVFPAANDNASGPAIVLEIARALAAHHEMLQNSLIFVAFAGEEEGLLGSEAFVQRSLTTPWRPDNIVAFINLDVAGCCGDTLAGSDDSFPLHARLQSAADRLGHSFGYTPGVGGSDHFTYVRRRVPAIMLAWTDSGALHTLRDTLDTVDVAHLQEAGEVATQAILELAAAQ